MTLVPARFGQAFLLSFRTSTLRRIFVFHLNAPSIINSMRSNITVSIIIVYQSIHQYDILVDKLPLTVPQTARCFY